ncbi:glycosyl hydrolase family 16 [Colletotrichum truncatum]|uniref:Glycosyl hydrolase family 16 n=1 Tax=Colletotrichum truncatum TaxID=5467 RepID=A0ACC3YYR8_COLTU|nr:glycosyl hydrolase family 16 [Colletotrichum truncatum]KAF6781825.1 glycosyl hydrolase family 16 [Colletotrichum truncatum]
MLSRYTLSAVALLASLAQPAVAQVSTKCNPMNTTCPADPAFGMDYNFNFNATPSTDAWETTVRPVKYTAENGAEFTISKQGESPTIRTKFYFFFGRTEIHLRAATGKGIVSSMMWLSDTLDEVDWEFLGVKNDALSNFFGKGVEDFKNGAEHAVSGSIHSDFHNYTTVWTKDKLEWWVDGALVRTLLPAQANNGQSYPQTPMRLSLGIWAGGDPRMAPGTREWAGGDTDYAAGPYTMYVKSAQVTDYSSGKEYSFGDKSGSWESIKITEGNSTVKEALLEEPSKSMKEKFETLSPTAKTAVAASSVGVGCALIAFGLWYFFRQRRRGAAEAALAARRAEEERLEMERFQKSGIDPDSFNGATGTEYNAKDFSKNGMVQENSYSVPATQDRAVWDTAPAITAGAAGGMPSYTNAPNGQTPTLPPLRTQSPSVPPSGPLPMAPARTASHGGYSRLGSPDQHSPPPMSPPHGGYSDNAFGNQQNYGNNGFGGANQGYWNNGGSQGGFR